MKLHPTFSALLAILFSINSIPVYAELQNLPINPAGTQPTKPIPPQIPVTPLTEPASTPAVSSASGEVVMGDFTGDGEVDLNDFNRFKVNFGQNGRENSWNEGDINGDGWVNLDDFTHFRRVIGNPELQVPVLHVDSEIEVIYNEEHGFAEYLEVTVTINNPQFAGENNSAILPGFSICNADGTHCSQTYGMGMTAINNPAERLTYVRRVEIGEFSTVLTMQNNQAISLHLDAHISERLLTTTEVEIDIPHHLLLPQGNPPRPDIVPPHLIVLSPEHTVLRADEDLNLRLKVLEDGPELSMNIRICERNNPSICPVEAQVHPTPWQELLFNQPENAFRDDTRYDIFISITDRGGNTVNKQLSLTILPQTEGIPPSFGPPPSAPAASLGSPKTENTKRKRSFRNEFSKNRLK